MPSGASNVPGVVMWPERLKIPQPLVFSVPMLANQSAPFSRMSGALAIDSTLFTFVGLAYTPATAGNGGLFRGSPRLPSSESSSAVSSPQMYAPAPAWMMTSRSNPEPRMFWPRYPAARASWTACRSRRMTCRTSPRT